MWSQFDQDLIIGLVEVRFTVRLGLVTVSLGFERLNRAWFQLDKGLCGTGIRQGLDYSLSRVWPGFGWDLSTV